ncbi:hypothetical protein DPMN_024830 [Dreissena polymorpha]|uniref:Saposin B-type domain-containing protein n=1 Tax=Dreissena polymorpha TaxID=45954 RepID=A0A9D4LN71_DREPO|nr:hypothetical protein DPMN_024830 [Dreissena polymorpha]
MTLSLSILSQDTVGCQICKFVVLAADNLLGENKTAAAVKSTLDKLCNDLPGELKDTVIEWVFIRSEIVHVGTL